jgi:hypothetical protein
VTGTEGATVVDSKDVPSTLACFTLEDPPVMAYVRGKFTGQFSLRYYNPPSLLIPNLSAYLWLLHVMKMMDKCDTIGK